MQDGVVGRFKEELTHLTITYVGKQTDMAKVKWLWHETRNLKAVGSNPSAVYWMDILSHCLLEKL